jgi:hypothetical protein
VKTKHEEIPLWSGIGLSHASLTITWSEAAVSRICSLLVLWWYFYTNKLTRAGTFLSKLSTAQGSEKFPLGKDSQKSLMKGLESWAKYSDPAIAELQKKVSAKAADRLKDLLALAKHDGAADEKDEANDQLIGDAAPLVGLDAGEAETLDDVDQVEGEEVSGPEEET